MEDNQDKRITILETNYLNMSDKIDELKKTVDLGFKDLKNEFKLMREENEKKYASKLVEKIAYGLVSLIIITVAGALITGVIK